MTTEETELNSHVRGLLKDYVPEHIARDPVQYSHELVSELFTETLHAIPELEPTMLALPVDPLTSLATRLKLQDLKDYQETWKTTSESVQLLKDTMFTGGKPITRRLFEDNVPVEGKALRPRALSPTILSRTARKRTPKPGKNKLSGTNKEHESLRSVVQRHLPSSVEEEDSDDQDTGKMEDFADVKLTLSSEERAAVIALQRNNPFLSMKVDDAKRRVPSHVKAFLSDRPFHSSVSAYANATSSNRSISPPIFTRDRRGISTLFNNQSSIAPKTPADLLEYIQPVPIPTEVEEEDLADANMAVIDGWNTLPTLSSQLSLSTPSLCTGTSEVDELDEDLWMPTSSPKLGQNSEGNSKRSSRLIDSRLHEHIMPRERNSLYQARESAKRLTGAENFSSFITSILPELNEGLFKPTSEVAAVGGVSEAENTVHPPSPFPSLSMVGLPGSDDSKPAGILGEGGNNDEEEPDFDAFVGKLYEDVKGEGVGDFIMKEKIDENATTFMEVPNLPPPSDFKRKYVLPTNLSSLVIDEKRAHRVGDGGSEDLSKSFKILEKVKGVKSLNIELSWRPFTFGRSVPTNEEVIDVLESPILTLTKGGDIDRCRQDAARQLLRSLDNPDSVNDISKRILRDTLLAKTDTETEAAITRLLSPSGANDDTLFIFTRKERLKLAGVEDCGQKGYGTITGLQTNSPSAPLNTDSKRARAYQSSAECNEPYEMDPQECYARRDEVGDDVACIEPRILMPSSNNEVFPDDEMMDWGAPEIPLRQWPEQASSDPDVIEHGEGPGVLRHIVHDSGFQSTSPPQNRSLPMEGVNSGMEKIAVFHDNRPLSMPASVGADADHCDEYIPGQLRRVRRPPLPEDRVPVEQLQTLKTKSRRDGLNFFMKLRGKTTVHSPEPSPPKAPSPIFSKEDDGGDLLHAQPATPSIAPDDLLAASNAFILPIDWSPPSSPLRVIISLNLLQRRNLFRLLTSPTSCAFHVIERDQLTSGMDIIINPATAIMYFTLATLSTCRSELMQQLCDASRRFKRVLVVFVAFPPSRMDRQSHIGNAERPYAYGPPVLSALGRFRRDIALHQGSGELAEGFDVRVAFADQVDEAAKLVRCFADVALKEDGRDVSECFAEDEAEGENDLAAMEGMNLAAANIMLAQASLDDILVMSPEQRMELYVPLLGADRVTRFNAIILKRMEVLDLDLPTSSDLPPLSDNGAFQ